MIRNLTLVLCSLAFSSGPAWSAVGPPTRPLSEILLDLDDAPLSTVKKVAELQAKEQFETDKGPLYKSAPAMLNSDPKKLSDEVFFEGYITPTSANSKLAIFSDDGCDVWIDGVLVLNNFGKGKHLPDLKQSLHVLEKFKPVAGRTYQIKIHYCNTIYGGKADIDGCTLFAFGAPMEMPRVELTGTKGEGAKKWIIATIPPPRQEPNKWSAKLIGAQESGAKILYKRGKADAAPVPGDGAKDIVFTKGKLSHDIQLLDGKEKVPTLTVAKGIATISGVQQGDSILIEAGKAGRDVVAVVKNFTWNDLQRAGGKITVHPDYQELPQPLRDNILETIKFALNLDENSAQSKQRQVFEKELAKKFPDAKLATLKIPSALGIGPLPWDYNHGHVASVALPPDWAKQTDVLARFSKMKQDEFGIATDLLDKNQTGYLDAKDRIKYAKLHKALKSSYNAHLINAARTEAPLVVHHTLEFFDYGFKLLPGEPIRNIRTDFSRPPQLFLPPDITDASSWKKAIGQELTEVAFDVDKNGRVFLYPGSFQTLAGRTIFSETFVGEPLTPALGASLQVNDALGD
ncbi:MAG: hypothetical protein K2R98_05065 [Gemmataceae bacterium]|nr:hypothetical protein [Gemmataceae bacterium]